MKIETECKFKVKDFARVKKRLRVLRATREESGVETNWILGVPRGRKSTKGSLRVRWNGKGQLTLKEHRRAKGVKEADEYQLDIGRSIRDVKELLLIFERLGFQVIFKYRKHREFWYLGYTLITLDTLPVIGRYVEVEARGVRRVFSVAELLGLSGAKRSTKSYVRLLKEAGYMGDRK